VVNHRQPRLAGGLNHKTGADVVTVDNHRVTAREPRGGKVATIPDSGHDVVRMVTERGAPIDGQEHLQHERIGVLGRHALRRDDDDRASLVEIDQFEVAQVKRAPGAADQFRPAGVADPMAQLILHSDLVFFGQDGDRGPPAAPVGFDQLGHDCVHLVGPAENDGVSLLDHRRTALA